MIPHRDGTVTVECSKDCMAKEHVLVERDYEGGIFVWAVFGPHRPEKIEEVRTLCIEYLEVVDSESAFVLQPIKTSTTKGLIKALREDIKDYLRALEEDEILEVPNVSIENLLHPAGGASDETHGEAAERLLRLGMERLSFHPPNIS